MSAAGTAPDTIVLIHGLWMTPRSWEHWVPYYEGKGYRVLTPTYPGFEVEVEAFKADPSPIASLTVPEVVSHLAGVVTELEKEPLIMGHSFGGTLTQLLLDHGCGAAGVAIDSALTEGVTSRRRRSSSRSSRSSRALPTGTRRSASRPRSSTTRSPTRSTRRSPGRSTTATTSRRPGTGSSATAS